MWPVFNKDSPSGEYSFVWVCVNFWTWAIFNRLLLSRWSVALFHTDSGGAGYRFVWVFVNSWTLGLLNSFPSESVKRGPFLYTLSHMEISICLILCKFPNFGDPQSPPFESVKCGPFLHRPIQRKYSFVCVCVNSWPFGIYNSFSSESEKCGPFSTLTQTKQNIPVL